MKRLRIDSMARTAIALSLGLSCLAPAQARDVAVSHAKGQTILAKTPGKVAVYDLATLDILAALGVEAVAGVPKGADGKTSFPPHLAKFAGTRFQNVGTLFEPDLAALTALKPDLIVVGGRSARKYDAVGAIAPAIDMSSSNPDLAATAVENTRKLAAIFGVADRAEKRIASFEAQLASLHAEAAKSGTGLLLFAAGQGVTVHAPGDRFGTVYDFVGIRPAIAPAEPAAAAPRPAVGSPEAQAAARKREDALHAALASDPTWLFVIDRNAATGTSPSTIAAKLAANERVAATGAWKAGRVIYLDPKTWYLVGAGIDALSKSARDTLAALRSANN